MIEQNEKSLAEERVPLNWMEKTVFVFLLLYALFSSISIAGSNMSVSIATLFAMICFIRRPFKIQIEKRFIVVIGVFFLTLLVSSIFAYKPSVGIKTIWKHFCHMLPLFLAVPFLKTRRQMMSVLILMAVSIGIADGYAIWQGAYEHLRAKGFSANQMIFAGYLTLMIPILAVISLNLRPLELKAKICFITISVLSLVALIYKGTRGALLAVAVALILYAMMRVQSKKWKMAGVITVFIIFGIVIALFPQVQSRFSTLSNIRQSSDYERILIWRGAWRMFLDHPLTGVGPGNFKTLYRERYISAEAFMRKCPHAHNNFLQFLAEGGILGFAGFMLLFGGILCFICREYRRGNKANPLPLAAFLATIALLLQGLTEYNFGDSAVIRMYWFILGLYYAGQSIGFNEERPLLEKPMEKEGLSGVDDGPAGKEAPIA
ncbi:MAG TPA: O-antigen ligase [Bacillota bacterium]|nr:O-antigen ligase [Bacillota bacterium]